jgi:hypothetical protein
MTTQVPSLSTWAEVTVVVAMTTQVASLSTWAEVTVLFAIVAEIGQEMIELCVLNKAVIVISKMVLDEPGDCDSREERCGPLYLEIQSDLLTSRDELSIT